MKYFLEMNNNPLKANYMKKRIPLTVEEKSEHKHSLFSGSPAVYCGTYHKYNCGSLRGMWIDLTSFYDFDEFREFCLRLHADENDPELMFQDYENFPEAWYHESFINEETFDKIIEFSKLDEDKQNAFDEYLSNNNGSASVSEFEEKIYGYADSEADFAESYIRENGGIPAHLEGLIDFQRYWDSTLRYSFAMYGRIVLETY